MSGKNETKFSSRKKFVSDARFASSLSQNPHSVASKDFHAWRNEFQQHLKRRAARDKRRNHKPTVLPKTSKELDLLDDDDEDEEEDEYDNLDGFIVPE